MTQQDVEGAREATPGPLFIRVTAGKGKGRTKMAAFDAALQSAGVADHNLIRLSSVIPARSVVEVCPPEEQLRGGFGDALYCVYSAAWATERGDDAWAGIGWSLARDGSGRGLFVEHSGHAREQVSSMILASLADMSSARNDGYVFQDKVLSSAHCSGHPVCSVVLATYRIADWRVT